MNNNLWSLITAFLKQRMRTKRWRRAVTCLAAVIVFGVTYALILPAITMTGKYPVLSAETLTAWTGDELTVKVSAETAPEDGGKIIVLTLEGEGADLSQNYAFNEEGVCIILDEAQNEIELHRAVRDKVENTVDYWFAMEPGTQTVFTLNLADEVDAARFAETMEAVKVSGEEKAAEAEKATASDAGKSAAVVTEKRDGSPMTRRRPPPRATRRRLPRATRMLRKRTSLRITAKRRSRQKPARKDSRRSWTALSSTTLKLKKKRKRRPRSSRS